MKQIIIYNLFILVLLSTSCKKDDTINNNNTNTFQGIADGKLIAINTDGTLFSGGISNIITGINTSNGNSIWSFNNRFFTNTFPYNNSIYSISILINNSKLYNINLDNGTFNDSVIYNGKTYFSSCFNSNNVYHSEGIIGELYNIHAYNLLSNIPTWTKSIKSIFTYNTICTNSNIYYTSNDSICALNSTNGNLIWATKLNLTLNNFRSRYTSLMINDNKLYFAVNAITPLFYCINALTGSVIWSKKIIMNDKYYPIYSIENNNLVIAEHGDSDGKRIHLVDKNNGNLIWTYTALKNIASSPTLKNNKVFFSVLDSNHYCLNASTGNVIWQYKSNNQLNTINSGDFVGHISIAPIVADSAVFFTSGGYVHTHSVNSGNLMWQYNFGRNNNTIVTTLGALVLRDSIYYPGGIVIHK